MTRLLIAAQNFLADRRGITAIEYAVLAGGISVALVAVFSNTGIFATLQTKMNDIITAIPTN